MSQHKHSIFAFVFVLLSLFVLSGCTSQPAPEDQQSEPVTLQWRGVFLDPDILQPILDEYHNLHPNITIEYANAWRDGKSTIISKAYQDEIDRVLREENAAAIPDIFMVGNTWTGNYEEYVYPAPSSVIDKDTVATVFYPAVSTDFVSNDSVLGLPLWMDTLAVIYNRKILTNEQLQVPASDWNDFKQQALALTQRSGSQITTSGFAAGMGSNVGFGSEIFSLLLLQNGVALSDRNGNPAFALDTDALQALNFYKSFLGNSGSWDNTFADEALAFTQGNLAMMIAPSWRYYDVLYFNDKYNLGLDIGVTSVPQLQGQSPAIINWATYWGNMVSAQSNHPQEAWEFLVWITQPEQLKKINDNLKAERKFFGILYPRQDMQQELQADKYLRVFNSALPTAMSWYMVDGLAARSELIKLLDESSPTQSKLSNAQTEIQDIVNNKGNL